jgi:UDP-N-acetylglucosamine 1-carboxyvinyltransferase
MDSIVVTGNGPLNGDIPIAGAKNACLTLMPATLLSDEPLTLTNAPRLSDIRMMSELLRSLGAEVSTLQDGKVLAMSSHGLTSQRAEYDIVRKMRASILVLGPMLARMGYAEVSLPGGCAIGARPVDLHLKAFEAMGADLDLRDGYVHATAPAGGLRGGEVVFPLVSVGATENALMAATLAKGTTVLKNAAREPEIVDLAQCLRKMGAQISGEGTSTITIQGVDRLGGATHSVVTDRIELGTYMLAPAICGGEVTCLGGRIDLVEAFCEKLDAAGVSVEETARGLKVSRRLGGRCHDRTFPRLPDGSSGPNDGAAVYSRRRVRAGRKDFREPVHACAGTDPNGRADRRTRRNGYGHRGGPAARCACDGDRFASKRVAHPGRTRGRGGNNRQSGVPPRSRVRKR